MRTMKLLIFLCVSIWAGSVSAGNYTVKKGKTIDVGCTASAPNGGWITHTFYNLVDQSDAEYLGMSYSSSDCKVTYYGLKAKSRIKVEVTYAYSYRGSYDNNIHVGSASYYDYITVTGAPDATSIEIEEDIQSMRVGQTITLHPKYLPSGSEGWVTWGPVTSLTTYGAFDIETSSNGSACKITAKRKGTLYLVACLYGDTKKAIVKVIKASIDAEVEEPTAIAFESSSVSLETGKTQQLSTVLTPSSAYTEITWTSSNSSIASVDEKGSVTANAAGTATITATTTNGLTASATITVSPSITRFSIPTSTSFCMGYTYKLTPKVYPETSISDITWKSSDTSVATISSSGVITAKTVGKTTITATSAKANQTSNIEVTILPVDENINYRVANSRLSVVKGLINKTIIK